MNARLKYINAINILASAKTGALQAIHDNFDGDWERAWHSDLSRFLPRDRDVEGKLVPADYNKLKKTISPDKEWSRLVSPIAKIDLITIYDNNYPALLRFIHDPPYVLYTRGSQKTLGSDCFGIVGTRSLTEYGKRVASQIARDVSGAGLTIVSGLAMGIDTLAHKAAVEAGMPTIAVLGCGIDDRTVFPAANLGLAHKIIASGGAVISEYAPGARGTKFTFPQRNRIISGLARGVLVVEADIQSGAMITAKCAAEQGRDVFAIPGSIFSKMSEGVNYLIKSGATPVTSAADILEKFNISWKQKKQIIKADNAFEEKILSILSNDPVSVDDIIRRTGLDAPAANATLMIMELNKKVSNLGGGKFILYT